MKYLKSISAISLAAFALLFGVVWLTKGHNSVNNQFPATGGSLQNTTNSSGSQPVSADRCVITIQGKKYDVTSLRSTHPGGDVFVCGTDQTALFFSKHDQNLLDTKMARYLVN